MKQKIMKVSKKAAGLVGSEIIKLAGEIKALQAQGEVIYNLTIGDFNPEIFPIPDELKAEIIRAYQENITNYPGAWGMEELRVSASNLIERKMGLKYDPNSEFLISAGARPLIFAAYQAIVNPGEKVIYPIPSWNNNHYCHLTEAEKVVVMTTPENNFMPTDAEIAPHVKDAALIALCSPLNPTGTTFTKSQLESICDLVIAENRRRGPDAKPLYIMYDQIYWQLTHGKTVHHDPVSLRPEMRDYTIYIDGISKAFAATGVRVGWSFGPKPVIERMKTLLSHVGAWSPKSEQVATGRYLANDEQVDTFIDAFKIQLNDRLEGLYKGFSDLKSKGFPVDAIPPQAAIYLTVKIDLKGAVTPSGAVLETNRDVHKYILNNAGKGIVPFYAFGAPDEWAWYRISVGTLAMSDMPSMFQKFEQALSVLKLPQATA